MFKIIKKIWCDTTSFQGRYVAKDVRNAVAFLVGVFLIIASVLGGFFGKSIDLQGGIFLLAYSLGGQTVKEYFKTKNNAIAADSSTTDLPQDNETPNFDRVQ